jgi:hypothetical protein
MTRLAFGSVVVATGPHGVLDHFPGNLRRRWPSAAAAAFVYSPDGRVGSTEIRLSGPTVGIHEKAEVVALRHRVEPGACGIARSSEPSVELGGTEPPLS